MNFAAIGQDESRRETAVAFLASVLIHLLLVLGVGIFLLRAPRFLAPEESKEEEPLQLTLLPPVPVVPSRPQFISTRPQKKLERQPDKRAPFESDNDSLAASELPPSGTAAVPTVDGREGPHIELHDQQYTAGKADRPAVPATPAEAAPAPPEKAQPVPKRRTESELALLEAPKPTPERQPKEKAESPTQPRPRAQSGYQSETRVTRLRGNVSNRGRASVEANATPLGKFKKQVSDAIGSRWYYYVNSQMGLLNIGTVEVRFIVNPEGKVKSPRVLSNTSNESFASVSLSAILEAKIPPIPPEVVKLLENGRLEIDYSFTILGN
jgi:outer membrane biosynthesis protein TonB